MDLTNFKTLRQKSIDLKSQKMYLASEIEKLELKKDSQEQRYNNCKRARIIIQHAAQKTQKTIENVICSIVTKAIQAVFDKPYEYKAVFRIARNKTECELYTELDGNRINPLEGNAGGLCDVIAFGNRIAFLKMDKRNKRNILLLDEPFKFLHSPKMQQRCSDMINSLSEKFGIQTIIVSNQENITGHKKFVMKNYKLMKEI